MTELKVIKYLSLFSGVGGFELGIQRAFDNRPTGQEEQTDTLDKVSADTSQRNTRQPAACIGYSEIDKYAIQTYEKNWKGHKNYGDATTINPKELPDFGLLVGGFPCQAFSIAGKRKGFDDTRGTLFFDIARILKHKRPRHLVLENVKGLLSHDSGKTFQTILGVLSDLGYGVEWQVLNGKRWVPQNRERIIIIGHLREECGRKVLPIRQTDGSVARSIRGARTKLPCVVRYDGGLTLERLGMTTWDNARIRRLTPIECERLMGWPDNWTEGVSDTQRYKQCGNGIIAPMVTAIIEKMELCL